MAILLREERAMEFSRCVEMHCPALVSAGNAIELATVSSRNTRLFDAAMVFLKQPYVRIEPVDADQVALAAEAYCRFGKGHHPARLNFGNMFAYALARSRNLPLLFGGNDFAQTDVISATESTQRHSRQNRKIEDDEPAVIHQRNVS